MREHWKSEKAPEILRILAETDGNDCTQMILPAPAGIWPVIRDEVADLCSEYADPDDWDAKHFAKEIAGRLERYGEVEFDGFSAVYRKGMSVFDTDEVTIKMDSPEDVYLRANITYIVLPAGL
jgi:hypothetical protein